MIYRKICLVKECVNENGDQEYCKIKAEDNEVKMMKLNIILLEKPTVSIYHFHPAKNISQVK